jgi:hypothetical protein
LDHHYKEETLMQRGKKLIALCGVVVVLAAVYGGIRVLTADEDAQGEQITVAEFSADTLTGLQWSMDETTVELTRSGDTWAYAGDSSFPMDQSAPESMLSAVCNVTATSQITEPQDLAEYGLETPALTVTITEESGTAHTFALGDENTLAQGYYMLYDGDESQIYVVDATLYDAFSKDLYDLVEMEDLPDFGTVEGIEITRGDQTQKITYVLDNAQLTYSENINWFLEGTDGTMEGLDTVKVSTLYSLVTGLTWDSCVAYKADDAALEEYGLGDDATLVTLTYKVSEDTSEESEETETTETTETFTLRIGIDAAAGTYAMIDGSTMVYLINTDTANSLRYASYSSLQTDQICGMDWDTVEEMEVTVDGETHTIRYDGTEEVEVSDEGEASVLETVDVYRDENDNQLDTESVQALMDAITGLTATGETGTPDTSSPLVQIVFHRDAQTYTEMELILYDYDEDSCLVSFDGKTTRLVDRASVTSLVDQISDLFSGE